MVSNFSLPTQRCFLKARPGFSAATLFSAYAEVFPIQRSERSCSTTFLCLRRGVSADRAKESCRAPFSLPTQRCFRPSPPSVHSACLFSAYAEVFRPDLPQAPDPQAFLCLRRGVSHRRHRLCRFIAFSLPTQRCFLAGLVMSLKDMLFSAYAEVFLSTPGRTRISPPFLCLRRGVSSPSSQTTAGISFSLPTQRCF